MNANRLGFGDETFDLVFGAGILHHLDLPTAIEEVRRVLRPGGTCVFHEPLGVNPVGKLVRALTPSARTADERPLGMDDLRRFAARFESRFHFEQLLCIPAAALSFLLFRRPDNPLMRAAYRADVALDRLVPTLGPLYRYVLIVGRKPARSTPSAASNPSK